jgi:hypothetical protein
MINFNRRTSVFVSREPTDMRSSYDALFAKAKSVLNQEGAPTVEYRLFFSILRPPLSLDFCQEKYRVWGQIRKIWVNFFGVYSEIVLTFWE